MYLVCAHKDIYARNAEKRNEAIWHTNKVHGTKHNVH